VRRHVTSVAARNQNLSARREAARDRTIRFRLTRRCGVRKQPGRSLPSQENIPSTLNYGSTMLNRVCSGLVLTLTAVAAAGCTSNDPTGAGARDLDDVIFLALSEPPNAHMDALFNGTVTIDDAGCIRLQNVERSTVVWPYGFTLDDGDDQLRVRDASGKVLGRVGGTFRFGGGHVPELHEGIDLPPALRERARTSCPGDFWVVGDTDFNG
jgi:hypothetical protein